MVRITNYFNFFTELILLIFLFLFSLILFFLGLSSSEKESARKVIKKLKKQDATTDRDSAIHFATRVRKLIKEGVTSKTSLLCDVDQDDLKDLFPPIVRKKLWRIINEK